MLRRSERSHDVQVGVLLMEISHLKYITDNLFLRWYVVNFPQVLNRNFEFVRTIDDTHMQWCTDNCKSGFVKCSEWMLAFEDRREALMFKVVFF